MIVHDVEQGTVAWKELRAGIPTSSEFSKILTPTGKPSKSQDGYMHHLIAERLTGRALDCEVISWDMERGSRMEQEAVDFYEMKQDTDTTEVGFITTDDGRIGTSPDRLVGDDGLLEIKCPKESVHVGYLLGRGADAKYRPQIMGQLWIAEREYVDILSYHPEMPEALVRVERDDKYIKDLAGAVRSFSDHLEEQYASLQRQLERGEPQDELELSREDIVAA